MKFYAYFCKFWDCDFNETKEESGFVCAESYDKAATRLTYWYGENHIINYTFYVYNDEGEPLVLPFDEVSALIDGRK